MHLLRRAGSGRADAAIQESMGVIANRPAEHLMATDKGIVMARRRLIDAANGLAGGENPPGRARHAARGAARRAGGRGARVSVKLDVIGAGLKPRRCKLDEYGR